MSYLTELSRFHERMISDPSSGMPPCGMTAERISFALVIAQDGSLIRVEDLRDSKGRPVLRFVPASAKRASNVASNFLWDNTGYVLGVDGKGDSERTRKTFAAFRKLHKELLAGNESIHARALLAFLEKWDPSQFESLDVREALLDSNVFFRLDGDSCFLHETDVLRNVWLTVRNNRDGEADGKGVCLVSGQTGPIARIHPAIKGVTGAQSSGAALVSFNCPSFTSYGKEQSLNAPVSESAARAYTSALNYLLQREHRQMVRIGDTCIVFWADRASPAETLFGGIFDFASASGDEQDQEQIQRIKGILLALRKGSSLNGADRELAHGTRFYILGLAPNAARLSVRFWLADTLEVLLGHVSRWYEDLEIERQFPDTEPEFPPLWQLLQAVAAFGKTENIPPEMGGQMARCLLFGAFFPKNVFFAVLQRIHADKKVGYFRAALIKVYLRRNEKEKMNMSTLDREERNVGYRLGRLFAVLEKTQKDALGGKINASLRERYIGAASATPRLVFPLLLRLAQHHVTKAGKETKYEAYETMFKRHVGDILENITDFPAVLPLADQGRFMLGYYHQNNALYQKKTDEIEE